MITVMCNHLFQYIDNLISGRTLIRLTEYKLEKIGITNVQHR